MDLLALDTAKAANEGRRLVVKHPTMGVPVTNPEADNAEVAITLLGRDSDVFLRAEAKARNDNIERLREGRAFTAEEIDLADSANLASLITGWENIPAAWVDGSKSTKPIEFSRENAVKLLRNKGVSWLYAQIDRFVGRRDAFLEPQPKT